MLLNIVYQGAPLLKSYKVIFNLYDAYCKENKANTLGSKYKQEFVKNMSFKHFYAVSNNF